VKGQPQILYFRAFPAAAIRLSGRLVEVNAAMKLQPRMIELSSGVCFIFYGFVE
jgi:hypothetical protein